ncbi:MAG: hypothetical protein V4689_21510 [Verrucomicrobiota bacterium]
MKTSLLILALASGAFAGPPVLARITPAALAKIQQGNPITDLPQTPESAPQVARPAEQSIIKQSMILHDGKNWTLVPKGAVIFLPEAMKSRVDAKPVGTLLSWADFLTKNVSWITTNEVSFEQAAGNQALPADRVTFWAKQDKIVVAVHQNGPISVNIAKESLTITQR